MIVSFPASILLLAASPPAAGGITQQQFEERRINALTAADTDGDGRISRSEFTARGARRGDPSRLFARIDADGNGMIERGEIAAMLQQRFHRLDTNGDGMLSMSERQAARLAVGGSAADPGR